MDWEDKEYAGEKSENRSQQTQNLAQAASHNLYKWVHQISLQLHFFLCILERQREEVMGEMGKIEGWEGLGRRRDWLMNAKDISSLKEVVTLFWQLEYIHAI